MEPDAEAIVTLARYDSIVEGMVARSQLEGEGIACFLADEHTSQIYAGFPPNLWGPRLQVRAADAARAAEILEIDWGGPPEATRCPRCGSARHQELRGLIQRLTEALAGRSVRSQTRRQRCQDCQLQWEETPE